MLRVVGLLLVVLGVAACSGSPSTSPSRSGSASAAASATALPSGTRSTSSSAAPTASGASGVRRKVMVIAEENHTEEDVLGSGRAPYLSELARLAKLTDMTAGYPVDCPSLPAYLFMTSGTTQGSATTPAPRSPDRRRPRSSPSSRTPAYSGVATPSPCPRRAPGTTLRWAATSSGTRPRRTTRATRCHDWDLPLGTPSTGALHDDVTAGTLPDYGFVTPNACDDMHGATCAPAT